MKRFITLLKDYEAETIDAIIFSTTTTPRDIDNIIEEGRLKKYDISDEIYNIDDLRNDLPKDCEMITIFSTVKW